MPIAPDVYKKIVTAKVYIDENFQEAVDLDRLSRQACLSRYHFHRLFTRIYQKTPHQYLTQKRVEQARLWLGDKELTVSEICNNVGFESIGSFSVLFKKEIGFAPQNYRNKALRQERPLRPYWKKGRWGLAYLVLRIAGASPITFVEASFLASPRLPMKN